MTNHRPFPPPAPGSLLDRLVRLGAKSLSDGELIALVLGAPGTRSAFAVARRLLDGYGSAKALLGVQPQVLCRRHGLELDESARLAVACELGFRCLTATPRLGTQVRQPSDLAPMLQHEFRGCDREHFLAVYLDTRHRIISLETVSIGSLNASLVHPREVFKPAVALGVAAVIAAHNHPSGDARPSGDDLELTARLASCGRLLGIELLDHVIVGNGEIVSLREYGWPAGGSGGSIDHF
ncbi:MAG: DNA repair protein RadC [bacterium]